MRRLEFSGSVPEVYDAELGPVVFEPYAVETARRVLELSGSGRWLEVAAGTGRVTRHLAGLGSGLVATDLQGSMLQIARVGAGAGFVVADATGLPFREEVFSGVLSQFGVMFYPEKMLGHREARRVLRPGGSYLFTSWAGHSSNLWAGEVQGAVEEMFPAEPPGFFRVPFSYDDEGRIEASLREAGFREVLFERVRRPWRAGSAAGFARGAVFGTPLGAGVSEIGGDPGRLARRVEERLASRFGEPSGGLAGEMTALYVVAR